MKRSKILFKINEVCIKHLFPAETKTDWLSRYEFFGQYGKVKRISFSKVSEGKKSKGAMITKVEYPSSISASLAFVGLKKYFYKGKRLQTFFTKTKFCKFYLNSKGCKKWDCKDLHESVDMDEYIEIGIGGHLQNVQHEYALKTINVHRLDLANLFYFDTNTVFPSITNILRKVERFTDKKTIFELQILSDPQNILYPTFKKPVASDKSTEEFGDSVSSECDSESSSESEEEEKLEFGDKNEDSTNKHPGVLSPTICRCTECIISRNNYRWNQTPSEVSIEGFRLRGNCYDNQWGCNNSLRHQGGPNRGCPMFVPVHLRRHHIENQTMTNFSSHLFEENNMFPTENEFAEGGINPMQFYSSYIPDSMDTFVLNGEGYMNGVTNSTHSLSQRVDNGLEFRQE